MKITILTPALAAILGLALASAPVTAQAQTSTNTTTAPAAPATPKPHKTTLSLSTIQAIDTTANTVTVLSHSKKDGDKTYVLTIDATTKVTRDHKPATLADFKVGEKVTGSYVADASGTLTAAKLTFTTPKPKTPKPAATTTAPAATPAAAPSTSAPASTQ